MDCCFSVAFYGKRWYIILKTHLQFFGIPHMKINREYLSRLWLLFWTFAKIAALVVGGGLAMLPVIEETFVNRKKILTSEELLDMISLTQTIPGIIAVNSAIYTGWKVAGLAGAFCAVAGVITPSFLVILCIAVLFPDLNPENIYIKGAFAGVRAAITGMIAVTVFNTLKKGVKSITDGTIVFLAFCACAIFKLNPAYVICAAMPAGLLLLAWNERKGVKK
jgi:chromate transporter